MFVVDSVPVAFDQLRVVESTRLRSKWHRGNAPDGVTHVPAWHVNMTRSPASDRAERTAFDERTHLPIIGPLARDAVASSRS